MTQEGSGKNRGPYLHAIGRDTSLYVAASE